MTERAVRARVESPHLHHLLSLKRKVSKETSNKKEVLLGVKRIHTNHIGS